MRLNVLVAIFAALMLLLSASSAQTNSIEVDDGLELPQPHFSDQQAEVRESSLKIVEETGNEEEEPEWPQDEQNKEELDLGAQTSTLTPQESVSTQTTPPNYVEDMSQSSAVEEKPVQVKEQFEEVPEKVAAIDSLPVIVKATASTPERPHHVEAPVRQPEPEPIVEFDSRMAEEEAHPIQLIYPSPDHEQLMVNETNLAFLASFNKPVAVVAVCGPLHSGKSFLMNQLLGRTSGFALGPTTEPKTRGLWMWNKPLEIDSKVVVFLDTEGLFASNISEAYDAKIFAISSLMSSYLIYNSVKFIDQSAIDYIELLARRAQLFGIKAEITDSSSEITKSDMDAFVSLPKLLWIVQDFVQEMVNGETPKEWLNHLLATRKKSESTASSLPELFGEIDCFTLFLPEYRREKLRHLDLVDDSELLPEYRADMSVLRTKVIENAVTKLRGKSSLTGAGVAALLRTLVSASNKGAFPEVPSIWKSFLTAQTQQAIQDSTKFYDSSMESHCDQRGPFNKQELDQIHSQTLNDTRSLFSRLTFGFKDLEKQHIEELLSKVSRLYTTYESSNSAKLTQLCQDNYQKSRDTFKLTVWNIVKPLRKTELAKILSMHYDEQVKNYRAHLSRFQQETAFSHYLAELQSNMKGEMSKVELENNELLVKVITNSSTEAIAKCSHYLHEQDTSELGVGIDILNKFKAEALKIAKTFFESKAGFALDGSTIAGPARKGLEKELEDVLSQFEVRNSERVQKRVNKVSLGIQGEISQLCDEIRLPQLKTVIEARVNKIRDEFLRKFDETVKDVRMMEPTKKARQDIIDSAKEDLHELYRTNNVKYDKIISRSLPDLKRSLAPLIDSYWWPYNAIDFAMRAVNSTLHTVELIENEEMIAELAQRFIDANLKEEIHSIWQKLYIVVGVGVTTVIGIIIMLCRKK